MAEMAMAGDTYEPLARIGHCAIRIKDRLYMWAGDHSNIPESHLKGTSTSYVEVFELPDGKWDRKNTTGNPPLGVSGYSAVAIDNEIFYFGGFCNHDSCFHNSLYSLDVNHVPTFKWTEFSGTVTSEHGYPSLKSRCGMVPLIIDGKKYLAVIGGLGPTAGNTPQQSTGTQYSKVEGYTWNNEVHFYDITKRRWDNPKEVRGDRSPPCAAFTLTLYDEDNNKAVMFGGNTHNGHSNTIYIVEFQLDLLVIYTRVQLISSSKSLLNKWPKGNERLSVLIKTDTSKPYLFMLEGRHCWLLNIEESSRLLEKFTEFLPKSVPEREGHSLSVWRVTSTTVWIIVFGGAKKSGVKLSDTAVIKLTFNDDKWSIGTVPLDRYTNILRERKNWEESDKLRRQLEDKDRRIQSMNEEICTKDEEIRTKDQQIQDKDQQIQECQERERTLQEAQANLEARIQQQESSWVVSRDEIHLTEEVIGRGGWGEVRVAHFCGLRVAAKCLHELIISPHNIDVFSREMDIASKVRHPNLLQFIGATREHEVNPFILTELMPTSLRKELESGSPLPYHAVLNISLDVACALNYLHLFRPHPILHRDVSSANVLLQPMGGIWRAKVSDYGSANLQDRIGKTNNPGCAIYEAPESSNPQLQTPAMDVYSYGVLLIEMIHCTLPDPKERENRISTITPQQFQDFIRPCLKQEKESRPTMAADIIAQLKQMINELSQ